MAGMRSRWRASSSHRRGIQRRGRGISDVIATILLLALTVTLFAAIFAFVTTFPSPPAQNNNQFQASLFYPSNGTLKWVAGIRIVHLAGPQVPGSGLIYLKSANQPTAPEFQSPYTVASGLPGGSTIWNLGQIWTLTFPITQMPQAASNITIYIVSQSQLLFSVILPGTTFHTPPTVVSTYTVPSTPIIGQPFVVYAALTGSYKMNSVYVNLGSVPGAPATPQRMTLNGLGQWIYNVSTGVTKLNGTFYGFVNASGLNGTGQTAIGTVVITIISNPGGIPITVEVVAVPQPPTNFIGADYFAAVITYTGTLTNAALNVSFWVNQTPHAPFTAHSKTSTPLTGPAQPLKISGPSTMTVYAIWPGGGSFSSWLLNSSVWVNVSATITGVGSASGSLTIATPLYVQGAVFYTKVPPSHTCTTTGSPPTCGYGNVTVWDNWTTALGGPASLSFSGTVWVSNTGNGTAHWTIGTTSVNQGSSITINPSGGRWKPSSLGTLEFFLTLTVYNGVTIVGWIYDTTTYSAT
ncbi:MAG TPA: type IV pilin [Thermoplasmata archaeon]|nr:type IV pilin [Thermoplasmata archaeon]